jgi:hypothetical protein
MKKDKRFKILNEENLGSVLDPKVVMILKDKKTGVNYLFFSRGYAGGLTPLLDKDGKLTTADEKW